LNWEIAAALGEIFGGTAVVLSVLYLAYQIRESRHQALAAAQRELLNTSHLYFPIATTPGATSDWRKGLNHYDDLDPDTQARFHHHMHPHINHVEAVFRMHRAGLIDDETYDRWMAGIVGILNTPGGAAWWSRVRTTFSPTYVTALEEKRDSAENTYTLTEHWHFYADDGEVEQAR
jgi:hypothetical protein